MISISSNLFESKLCPLFLRYPRFVLKSLSKRSSLVDNVMCHFSNKKEFVLISQTNALFTDSLFEFC
ncbi:hypothetical protein L1887_16500 [Cichorium endivia]|nr:hypothetical protein L1887_16500 [Cichorium endivia]